MDSQKKYASGFINTADEQTYYYRDDEAHEEIAKLQVTSTEDDNDYPDVW